MKLFDRLQNKLLKMKLLRQIEKTDYLYNLKVHAINTNFLLWKRNDVEVGMCSYGMPNIRTGGV